MRSWLNWKSGDQQQQSSPPSQPPQQSSQPPVHTTGNSNRHLNDSNSRFDDTPSSNTVGGGGDPSRQRSLRQQMMSAASGSSRNVYHPGNHFDDHHSGGNEYQHHHQQQQPHFGGGGGVIQALMAGRTPGSAAAADAEMERRVAISARNLGDGVSRIVLAARMGGGGGGSAGGKAHDPGEWKTRLLRLLGGADGEGGDCDDGGGSNPSDVDVLLANAGCERFVLRCVENELPPNLIHCLRLLRVLELQHDHAVATRQQRERERRRGGVDKEKIEIETEIENQKEKEKEIEIDIEIENLNEKENENETDREKENDEDDEDQQAARPVSTRAAKKVSRLLCLLCSDASVGEQLRPHLFGLLALSGASYPRSGVHIASAASDVILAFAASCLSASLVWFLHDRKMVVHMTDDVKELCSMAAVSAPASAASPSAASRCLYGPDAEKAGLWVVALRTVVHLVAHSCRHQCAELLRDYDAAGGYRVLAYAIANSTETHVSRLLELVTALVCCRTDRDIAAGQRGRGGSGDGRGPDDEDAALMSLDLAESKVATNTDAFEIIDDLMVRSISLIRAYKARHDGRRPAFRLDADFAAMADFAVDYAWDGLANASSSSSASVAEDRPKADLVSELLVTTLQLYSDHAKNFDLIESEYHMLSHYIFAFPSFSDVSVKVLTLKTLEYVCTGLAVANSVVPLKIATEVFVAMSKRLLTEATRLKESTPLENQSQTNNGEEGTKTNTNLAETAIDGKDDSDRVKEGHAKTFRTIVQDSQLLCDTLVKLLEFDERVSYVMLDCGLLGAKVDDMLDLIMVSVMGIDASASNEQYEEEKNGEEKVEKEDKEEVAYDAESAQPSPAESSTMDEIYECVCRVLKNVVLNPEARAVHGDRGHNSMMTGQTIACDSSLNTFLTVGILHLGDKASKAALGVFEGMMSKNHDELLRSDMACVIDLIDKFDPTVGTSPKSSSDRGADAPSSIMPNGYKKVDKLYIARQNAMVDILTNILSTNEPAQEVFRTCGGFECVVRMFFRLTGSIIAPKSAQRENDSDDVDDPKDDENKAVSSAIMKLLESAFKLVATATKPVSRNQKNSSDLSTPPLAIDVLGDDDASITGTVMSSSAAPSTTNLIYLRNYGFYIEFANAMAESGVLLDLMNARAVVNMALEIIHPKLVLIDGKRSNSESKGQDNINVHNADAVRLVLGIVIRLPESSSNVSLAKNAFDEILRLCANDMAGSSLTRLASSGLCSSLTNPNEFAHMLEDRSHFLYSRFVLLLRRLAAFSMTYNDFVSLLRCVAGPILLAEQEDRDETTNASSLKRKRIRLAVISSSVQTKKAAVVTKSEAWQSRETGFCNRLETLSVIAERGDRVARCEVGGDSLNTIAMYMQKVPLEDRIYKLAEEGRLKFLEIESIDASAKSLAGTASATPQSSQAAANAAIWNPLVSTGFTYCAWLRQHHPIKDGSPCSLFVFDISTPPVENAPDGSFPYGSCGHDFFSFWYDIPNQRFCVLSSSNSRGEPTCFPMSPLPAGVWHHILLTYQAPKRSMLGRKAVLTLYIDGRPVEADAKVDTFNLPPTARIHIGVPNPVLASSGIIRGSLPVWDLGPTLLLSTVLGLRDATAMYTAGPDFPGLFWGDRPQRLSLAAAATAAFVMLAENGEKGSVAGALRRRKVPSMEAVGHVMRERGFGGGPAAGPESDSLSAVGLLCKLTPENVIFGFRAFSSSSSMRDDSSSNSRRHFSRRLINVSRISSNAPVSTDAVVYGYSSIIAPNCFADNVQWIGGPNILLPVVNASQSSSSLALSLRMIRESVRRHPPNLEMLQAGGGYRMLALLLRQKRIMDVNVLDQCFAFAVHGFVPGATEKESSKSKGAKNDPNSVSALSKVATHRWVFADLDAMKYLLLNHQVWDLSGAGPELPLRLLTYFNGLVVAHSTHAAFNSRRLHLLGIIRWTLHLMLEATELYAAGASAASAATVGKKSDDHDEQFLRSVSMDAGTNKLGIAGTTALKNGWLAKPPSVSRVAAGGDPSNEMLLGCKTLLRRVLTFMLTPGDLEAIAGAAIYTVSITGGSAQEPNPEDFQDGQLPQGSDASREKLAPGAVARVYLLRLLEELVVDGVNEIVADDNKGGADGDGPKDAAVEPHSGGGYSAGRGKGDAIQHPKHQEAQIFLSAFAGILTPVWFACILEGCREEASASAVLRLMILMIQNSRKFAIAFEEAGGFAPLVLSIPKFSTCPSIILSMLSHLLHAPILHLPCFAALDPKQLCEVFDQESDAPDLINNDYQDSLRGPSDPSCGIFALLAECLGRNIQLASFDSEMGRKARNTNEAVLHLLSHRHAFSIAFQDFCRTPDFLEPLAQALCLVHDEKLQKMQRSAFGGPPLPKQGDEEFSMSYGTEDGNEYAGQYNENVDSHSSGDDVPWASNQQQEKPKRMNRRGSLCEVRTDETPTERFVGKIEEEGEGSGIGMVQLLHLVLSHAVLKGPLAAPLVSALFRSFPIHASPDQVEAFHLVLIEHCRSVVEDALQRGEPIALANCIGVSSVLLDRLMAGFFTSEPVLEAVNIVMLTLNCLTASGTYASRTLANVDQNLLVADTAHIARLTCLTALHRSRPMGAYDEGDDELKLAVLTKIGQSMRQLLLVPSNLLGAQASRRQGYPTPAPNTRFFPLWQSASLSRCCPPSVSCTYPDLTMIDEPDRAFVITLMADIHSMLLDSRRDIREQAVVVVVSLLQRRRGIMSELLITDIPRGDRIDTVDLMNRGGFGALLVAHEATTIAENVGPGKNMSQERSSSIPGKMKYGSFFEWLERNQEQVAAVFHGIHIQASRLDITTHVGAATPEEAIENEQKVMLLKLTSQDSSDRTILGGLERAELAQLSHEATAESHALWKRQGFDDLSSGAMQWKFLLRQLKGSCTIWEGGVNFDEYSLFAKSRLVSKLLARRDDSEDSDDKSNAVVTDNTVKRWKLDLTEGYERQRRRLLPNYEFHGLYNIDEKSDNVGYVDTVAAEAVENGEDAATENITESDTATLADSSASANPTQSTESGEAYGQSVQDVLPAEMEITADLLKKMKLEKRNDQYEDEFENMDMDDEENDDYGIGLGDDVSVLGTFTVAGDESVHPSMLSDRKNQASNDPDSKNQDEDENDNVEDENDKNNISASSYDLITGLLKAGDWPEKSYNVNRCTGLEVRKALLLWCRNALYVVDGFEQTDGEGLKGKINRLKKATTSYQVNIRGTSGTGGITRERNKGKEKSSNENSDEEITYQHRSQRIAFSDLYSVYRRRYQLQQNALEFYDVHRNGTLLAFSTHTEREEVLSKVLSSPLPSSIFSSSILGGSTSINYKKFMNNLRAKITSQWVQGKMTNFDFIMHMNSFAGRTYNDLTQYPVFPWVLADYESEELDLNDPSIYRDLSKPMGAQNDNRAIQFRDRFEALEQSYEMGDGPPPFHYGTHYSCAAYVLYYLMRLEPFSRLALSLQGGKFDVADRLFHNIGGSWRSASSENLQDVRELIPEFFYLPDFLVNSNMFDFGTTQLGKTVHDLTLPPWAKGDPKRFIRIHRQALESDHVSRHLHQWLDLIFGYKQRGREAVASLNTFVHVTYEGQVDLESITDPVERDSIIAQIQNFGQTPSRLERKPFPQRNVFIAFKEKGVDFNALASLASMTPPFCVVGAPHRVYVRVGAIDTCKVGMAGQVDSSVGDLFLVKGQLIGVGRTCSLIIPSKKYYRFGGPNNGVSVHVAVASARHREVNKVLSIHDGMHRGPVSVARASLNGLWLVTGCVDSTVRVWKYNGQNMQLQATLCGHDGGKITCLDISTVFGTIVSGGIDGKILVWDLRTLTFLRQLNHLPSPSSASREGPRKTLPAKSVSINHKNGNIVTLVHNTLCVFDINGNLVARHDPEINFDGSDIPSCAISTDCPEWMENGVVAITGHINGDVRLWSIDYDCGIIILRHTIPERVHSCPITALRVSGDKQDTLLIGDKSGKMSVCNTLKLEQLNANELAAVIEEALEGEVY